MMKIYNENNKYLISVNTEQQLVGFMYDHELDFKSVIIKDNGNARKFTFEEATILGTKAMFLKYSEYYQMKKICSLANVSYQLFECWKESMENSITVDEMRRMMRVMQSIGYFNLKEADESLEKERQYNVDR